jgi:hypothetical protein
MISQKIPGFSRFWKNTKLTPQEQNENLRDACREVFSTPQGKIVLNMLLTDLFLYEKATTDDEGVLNEYAKFFIRERLGVGDTVALTDFIAETAAARGGNTHG